MPAVDHRQDPGAGGSSTLPVVVRPLAWASASEVRDAAIQGGMRLLRADGAQKVLAGRTTIEEVQRVTVRSSM